MDMEEDIGRGKKWAWEYSLGHEIRRKRTERVIRLRVWMEPWGD